MILYAAYVKGSLVDQVAAESEDTALAKLRMDYPKLEGEVTFEIIDGAYKEPEPKQEQVIVSATSKGEVDNGDQTGTERPVTVIEADKIEITLNVGSLDKEVVEQLTVAAKSGAIVAKAKGV